MAGDVPRRRRRAGPPRVRDLHVGLDGATQGGHDPPRRPGQLPRRHAPRPRRHSLRRPAGRHHALLRHRRAGAPPAPGRGGPRRARRQAPSPATASPWPRCWSPRAATLLQATPATWRMLLEAGWAGRPGLAMLCGGEALPRELADRLLACGGGAAGSGTCTGRPRRPSGPPPRASSRGPGRSPSAGRSPGAARLRARRPAAARAGGGRRRAVPGRRRRWRGATSGAPA